ncbi:MAG TPA: hypothetical protein VJT31_32010 [Rugosimonospora sp.]|nr:hypothetical protein [Rugosimonospora sp.]
MRHAEIFEEIGHGGSAEPLRSWVRGVLADIAAGASDISAVRHPLGFLCLPVRRSGAEGVCVHLWGGHLAPAELTTSDTHAHSWDLHSYVLFGRVHNELVEVSDAPGTATHRVYEVHSLGEVDEIRVTGRTVTRATSTVGVYRAGDAYTLPAGRFHRSVVPAGEQTATVALGRTRPGQHDLSLGPLGGRTHRVSRRRCDPAETARAARAVTDRIAAAHP